MDQPSSLRELDFSSGLDIEEGKVDNNRQPVSPVEPPGQNIETERNLAQARRNLPQARPAVQNTLSYYVSRRGVVYVDGGPGQIQSFRFYVESDTRNGNYDLVAELPRNDEGLVQFPATGNGLGMEFERYGRVDAGGDDRRQNETVGQGDHFLQPVVAAALFGLTKVLNDNGITMSYGDMSSSNGSDPWEPGQRHHKGHGHLGNQPGENVDFRYVDQNGRAFQADAATTDRRFDARINQFIYETARVFGFTQNIQGRGSNLPGVREDQDHNDHGHLGFEYNPDKIRLGRPPAPSRGR
jgi:hypothetical protein